MKSYVFPAQVERTFSGGYSLSFPDLDGCVTAASDDASLAARAREALQLHLEGMREEGLTIPPPSVLENIEPDPRVIATILVEVNVAGAPTSTTINLPAGLLDRVDGFAQSHGITRDQVIEAGTEALLKTG